MHPERLALLPFELTWHRATEAGQTVWRAVDNRQSPHVVYQVGKGEVRYGYPWYVSCWREGEENQAQAHEHLRNRAIAQQLAEHSRCSDCGGWFMFGDLEPRREGTEVFRCRDRAACQARAAETERKEREEFEAIDRQPWDSIKLRQGRVVPELVFTRNGGDARHASSAVVRVTDLDIATLMARLIRYQRHGELDG